MKRLLTCSVLALLTLSACDSDTITSPLEPPHQPELTEPAFAKTDPPDFQPITVCPVVNCPLDPVGLDRTTKAPAVRTENFQGSEGQEATLVIQASNPKTTTLKAWLNGALVVLPSQLPRSGSDRIEVPVTLLAENVLTVRLSAKPGTEVVVWVEGGDGDPLDSGGTLPVVFRVTSEIFPPAEDLSAACAVFGEGFRMADWTDVVQAVNGETAKEEILDTGLAFVLYNGVGFIPGGIFSLDGHYALSTLGSDGSTLDSVGTEMFWLTSTTFDLPVLCIGPEAGAE